MVGGFSSLSIDEFGLREPLFRFMVCAMGSGIYKKGKCFLLVFCLYKAVLYGNLPSCVSFSFFSFLSYVIYQECLVKTMVWQLTMASYTGHEQKRRN